MTATRQTRVSVSVGAMVLLIFCTSASEANGPAAKNNPAPAPIFKPGSEVTVKLPQAKSWAVVYVPKNYFPQRKWPVIVNYHTRYAGDNWQLARTKPFKQLTGGNGYIIIGMNYTSRAFYDAPQRASVAPEVRALAEALKIVEAQLEISRKMIFSAGFRTGAIAAGYIGESMLRDLAGIVILSGARLWLRGAKPPPANLIRGKPIFIGIGGKDIAMAEGTRDALDAYRKFGARVMFEVWPDQGHGIDMKRTRVRQWMDRVGPLQSAARDLATARKLESAGKTGQAYLLLTLLGNLSPINKDCQRAANAAIIIERRFSGQFELATRAVSDKNYAKAISQLKVLAARYDGCPFGKKASDELTRLQNDPTIGHLVTEQIINAKADTLEARARTAEKYKNYAQALKLYEHYVKAFPQATRHAEVAEHYRSLSNDPKIQAAVRQQGATRKCQRLLKLAASYHRAQMDDKARQCLIDVIEQYPDTEWSTKAKALLNDIDNPHPPVDPDASDP